MYNLSIKCDNINDNLSDPVCTSRTATRSVTFDAGRGGATTTVTKQGHSLLHAVVTIIICSTPPFDDDKDNYGGRCAACIANTAM